MGSQRQNEGNCSLLGVRPLYIESILFTCFLSLPSHFQSRCLKRTNIEQSKCECLCLCLFIYSNFWTTFIQISQRNNGIPLSAQAPNGRRFKREGVNGLCEGKSLCTYPGKKIFQVPRKLSQFSHFLMKSIHPRHRNRNTSFFGCDTASPAPVCCLVLMLRRNSECTVTWKSHTSLGINVSNH